MATDTKKSSAQKIRTRLNKIRKIKKALLIAQGSMIDALNTRLGFWERQK